MNEQYCNNIVDNIVHAGQLNVAVTNNNTVRFYVYVRTPLSYQFPQLKKIIIVFFNPKRPVFILSQSQQK